MYCFIAPVTKQKTTDTYTSEFFRSSNNKNAKDMEKLKYYSMTPNDNAPYPVKEEGACCDQCNTTTEQSGWQRSPRREPREFYMKRKQTR